MLPSIIEWDKEDKLLQHQSFSSSSCTTASRSWWNTTSRSISSISIFPDEKDDFQESPNNHAQAPPTILIEADALPPVTESKWNLGVDELIKVGHSDLSPKSMRRMMDLDYKPECRTEAFQCLRRLNEWSDELEQSQRILKNVDASDNQKRKNSNSSLVRMKGSQLRRRLFSGDRESSFVM